MIFVIRRSLLFLGGQFYSRLGAQHVPFIAYTTQKQFIKEESTLLNLLSLLFGWIGVSWRDELNMSLGVMSCYPGFLRPSDPPESWLLALRLVVLVCAITDGPHQWPRMITRLFSKAQQLTVIHRSMRHPNEEWPRKLKYKGCGHYKLREVCKYIVPYVISSYNSNSSCWTIYRMLSVPQTKISAKPVNEADVTPS